MTVASEHIVEVPLDLDSLRAPAGFDSLMSGEDLCAALGISKHILSRMRLHENLPYIHIAKSVWYIQEQVLDWLMEYQRVTMPIEQEKLRITRERAKKYGF